MATAASSSTSIGGVSAKVSATPAADAVLRNTLRYTISAREYALLHRYIISRSQLLRRHTPSIDVMQVMLNAKPQSGGRGHEGRAEEGGSQNVPAAGGGDAMRSGGDDYNARAVRHSIRVFLATGIVTKAWQVLSSRLVRRKHGAPVNRNPKLPLHKSPALRLSLSLSTILLLYRLLLRFLTRLRIHLLDPSAAPFRNRNPRTAGTLTSPYAPAVGASVAGLALGIYPAQHLRASVALLAVFRALEFGWNLVEDSGIVWGWVKGANGKPERKRARPWWWGSWMLQPFALGQLFHAAVFDRDCVSTPIRTLLLRNAGVYLNDKPSDLPVGISWPNPYQIVGSLAEMARLNWPPFISPVLYPKKEDVLPQTLQAIAPIISPAHPLITSLSCATLHPSDPSCTRTSLTFWLRSFPPLTRLLLVIYSAALLPRLNSLYHLPVTTINRLVARALRMSTFLTGTFSTAWASICFFQAWLPRTFLPTQRFFAGGFVAGLWAWSERRHGRSVFLYTARASVDSLWKVGAKRRWWRAMKGGDVWVFVLALMLTGVVYERDARAVRETNWRRGISWVRGEGWRDWGIEPDDVDEEEDGEKAVRREE